MVFRILKSFVKVTVLLTLGAGIGIWYAPPLTKHLMKQKLAVAQKHTKGFQANANKLWTNNLQKKFASATRSIDLRKFDKKAIASWVQSGKNAVATISADAQHAQETLTKANQLLKSAKSEYRQAGTFFGM